MNIPSIFDIAPYLQDNPDQAVRTVLHQSADLNLVLWQIPPQGSLPPHRHPQGTDIWVVLQGEAELLDDEHSRRHIRAGESVVVGLGQTHGALNNSEADCVLLSVVNAQAGFQAACNPPHP